MNLRAFTHNYIHQLLSQGIQEIDHTQLTLATEMLIEARNLGHRVYLIGNGGSAALASHMATDFQLARLRAISLTDISAITTYTNDHGEEWNFSDQLYNLATSGDVCIAISGSGYSTNIIYGLIAAKAIGMKTISLVGMDGGRIKECGYSDCILHTPTEHMGVSQDLHQIQLHILTYYLMSTKEKS